ncbi:hypothetical protein [Metabacillus iocasae]|uniref:Lipoprotein n=1 Tax=Priestia iocasae TaxID=2291674 RepID=A0ABS2QXX6_9BACI|nr:hypothetical protein [Metabacillus iocasae]MBM7704336.1 hypothetical protein [Metabacillus iocasae]
MKKQLIIGLFVTSALFLGACSDKEQSVTTEKENNEKEEQVEEEENVLVFEVGGEKKEEELVPMSISSELAEELLLPSGFEGKELDENRFQAQGTDAYENFWVHVRKEKASSSLDREVRKFEMKITTFGGQGTEFKPLDMDKFPGLQERYDYAVEIVTGNDGTVQYTALSMDGEGLVTYVIVTIKNEEKKATHQDFAVELLKKVKLPEPV